MCARLALIGGWAFREATNCGLTFARVCRRFQAWSWQRHPESGGAGGRTVYMVLSVVVVVVVVVHVVCGALSRVAASERLFL